MARWTLGGIGFDWLCVDGAARKIVLYAERQKSCLAVTPNATMLHRAYHDQGFHALLASAELSVPDGAGVIAAAEYLDIPVRAEKIAGVALGERVIAYAADAGLSVYFFGGAEGVAEMAAEKLRARYPALAVSGCRHGYDFDTAAVADEIAKASPRIVFCCLGSPLQERVGRTLADRLSCPVLCLGGSLDVYAERVRRAPRFMQSLSLEWLWRMMREPHRFRGIGSLFGFLCDVVRLKKQKRACNREQKRI